MSSERRTVEPNLDPSAGAGLPSRKRRLTIAVAVLFSLTLWWVLHRYWYMAGDDYVHVGIGGAQGGRFTLADWWSALVQDWTVRNGRLADAAVRLVLRPGAWFYPWFAPLMLTGLGAAMGWAALQGRRGRPAAWVWAAGLLIVPTLFFFNPAMAGDAVFWASGAMNYVFPTLLLVISLAIFAHLIAGGDVAWVLMPFAVALIFLADAVQEMSALAQVFIALAVIVSQGRRMTLKLWVLAGSALAVFTLHMAAPGLWKRAGLVSEAAPGGAVARLGHAVAVSSTVLWERTSLLWFVVVGLCVWLALRPEARRSAQAMAWVGAVGAAAFCLAAAIYRNRVPAGTQAIHGIPPGMGLHTALVIAALALAAVGVALALWRSSDLLGSVALLAWVAFIGNCGFVFASGIYGTRAHFPPAVLLALLVLAAVASLAKGSVRADRLVVAAVIAGSLMPTLVWADDARVRLARNHGVVEQQVLVPLRAASGQAAGAVVIPALPPYPELTYGRAFQLPSLDQWLRNYFEIDDGVTLSNPTS